MPFIPLDFGADTECSFLKNGRPASTEPKKVYAKIWEAHRRLGKQGYTEQAIHNYCLDRYGMDLNINRTPTKSPKRNPDWVGGGKVAEKIKKAKETSRKSEVKWHQKR